MTVDGLTELSEHLAASHDEAVMESVVTHGQLTVVAHAERIVHLMRALRDDPLCQFDTLIDICGVDYPDRSARFDIVYHLLSVSQNQRIRVKVRVAEGEIVPSVEEVYPNANWYEREAFDLYGVPFANHSDLRRILTDYGFEGHPLRKDFPLTGFVEVRYDEEEKRVVYEPVSLQQEYRDFDFLSPWEGARYVLPGDEKAENAS